MHHSDYLMLVNVQVVFFVSRSYLIKKPRSSRYWSVATNGSPPLRIQTKMSTASSREREFFLIPHIGKKSPMVKMEQRRQIY